MLRPPIFQGPSTSDITQKNLYTCYESPATVKFCAAVKVVNTLTQSGLPLTTPLIDELDEINFFTSDIITGIPQGKGAHDMSVMPETVASRVATSNSDVLVEAGESQLIRVEPNDSRVDCSNYNPLGN